MARAPPSWSLRLLLFFYAALEPFQIPFAKPRRFPSRGTTARAGNALPVAPDPISPRAAAPPAPPCFVFAASGWFLGPDTRFECHPSASRLCLAAPALPPDDSLSARCRPDTPATAHGSHPQTVRFRTRSS